MTTSTAQAATMSVTERAATEAYAADLRAEFGRNVKVMNGARTFRNLEAYKRWYGISRETYRELAEVEVALITGILPF